MKRKEIERTKKIFYRGLLSIFLVSTCSYFLFLDFWNNLYAQEVSTSTDQMNMAPKLVMNPLNKEDYDRRLKIMAHGAATSSWPVKTEYPLSGALLPFNRIVAYYGNLYSKKMGVLGEYDTQTMLRKLNQEVIKWNAADPQTPVIPALHYIATTAQGLPRKDEEM
jgi:Tfp pilus assembly PilM family ATPase